MAELLSDIEIQRDLGSLQGWSRKGDVLTRTYQFRNFTQAIDFVNRDQSLKLTPAFNECVSAFARRFTELEAA